MISYSTNWQLLQRIDYGRPGAVRGALFNYDELMNLARKGDQVAHTVCVDIKRAIHAEGVLTFRQRRYLALWWQGFNTIEIATMYSVSHVGVIRMISRGIRNISDYLIKKVTIYPPESISNGKGLF